MKEYSVLTWCPLNKINGVQLIHKFTRIIHSANANLETLVTSSSRNLTGFMHMQSSDYYNSNEIIGVTARAEMK